MTGASPLAAFDVRLSSAVVALGGTITVDGGITLDQAVQAATVTLKRYKKADDSLVATIVSGTYDFEAGVQFPWDEMAPPGGGAYNEFTPTVAREEYLVATISGGTPEVTSETSQRFPYSVRPDEASFSSEPTPGDGTLTLHCTAAAETDVLYARWRTSGGGFTALSDDYKRTGSGDLEIPGTNGVRLEAELVPYAGGSYGIPSDPCFGTASDGSTAPAGQLSLPVDYLRKTVAASGAFQDWVGAENEVDALDSILPVCGALAEGRPTIVGGALTAIAVERGGRGYRTAPAVAIAGEGSGAVATAAVSGGKVTGFTVTNGGSGYSAENTEVRVARPTLPVAIVDWMPGRSKRAVATGTRTHFDGEGELLLLFRGEVDGGHDEEQAAYVFQNKIGAILADIEQLAGRAGYLDIREIRQVSGPQRPDEDELKTAGDYYQAIYAVRWEGL